MGIFDQNIVAQYIDDAQNQENANHIYSKHVFR